MKVVIVRHAEAESNISDICDGDPTSEIPLTPHGKEQARALGERLKHYHFDAIFVSEFLRTQQTYEEMALDKIATIDKRLNDIKTGFEGLSPQTYFDFIKTQPDPLAAKHGDGESILEVQERIRSFVDELKSKLFSTVLVVTHEACVQNMLFLLGKLAKEDIIEDLVPNASVHEIAF